jgi:hypothetical protein
MSAQSGRLQHALKHLREQWDIAQDTWDDPASRDFEKNHLVPLEQSSKNAIVGMEKLTEVLGKIRAQCKEDKRADRAPGLWGIHRREIVFLRREPGMRHS